MNMIRCILAIFVLATNHIVLAKDFGVKGHVFSIDEQPFLQMISERLEKVDMEKEKKKMQAITKDRVENPRAVEGISNADEDKSFYLDPTYVVEKDIILPCGKLLHKAGTKINPLDHMDFDRRLFVIDAREEPQVDWLKIKLKANIEEQTINHKNNQSKAKKL